MSGPFKLKYKNSSFPFKEQEGNDIVDAASDAYAVYEGVSATAEFMKGVAEKLPTSTKSTKDKDKDKDKHKKTHEKVQRWWKGVVAEKKASHQAWRESRKGK